MNLKHTFQRHRRASALVLTSLLASGLVLMPALAYHPPSPSPDGYYPGGGYVAKLSTDVGGPAYAFVDVSDGATLTLPDDGAEKVDIPFAFNFYGRDYQSLWVSSNGLLSTSGDLPSHGGGQQRFPDWRDPNGLIAPFWADLDPSVGGTVAYKTLGEAPNRQFVVMWKDVPQWRKVAVDPVSEPVRSTFEAILFEGSTKIQFHVQSVSSDAPTIPFFESNYASGIEDQWGQYGLSTRFADYTETFSESETAVEFERLISPPPPPPPPPAPIVTSYTGPFADSGDSHIEKNGNLPDRHASASSSATDAGALNLSSSADSLVPTLGAYPAEGQSSSWVQVPHTFAPTSTYASVTVRLRLNEMNSKASRVGGTGLFDPASTYSELSAVLTTNTGCSYDDYYYYDYPYDSDSSCSYRIRGIDSPVIAGESSYFLSAPKEVELTFSVDPNSSVTSLYVALKALSHADGAAAETSLAAKAQVLEVKVTERQSYPSCYYFSGDGFSYRCAIFIASKQQA